MTPEEMKQQYATTIMAFRTFHEAHADLSYAAAIPEYYAHCYPLQSAKELLLTFITLTTLMREFNEPEGHEACCNLVFSLVAKGSNRNDLTDEDRAAVRKRLN